MAQTEVEMSEESQERPNREFVIDLDEVLGNFVAAACTVHRKDIYRGPKYDFYASEWGMTQEQFWGPIHAIGDNFYRDMVQPFPWTFSLLEKVKEIGDFVIMSTPGIGSPKDYPGKRIWVDKHVPGAKLIVGGSKDWLARPNRMLIDDNNENASAFMARGGQALLFPRPWNRNSHIGPLKSEEYVNMRLREFRDWSY
jgi:hypothetical protein